MNIISFCVSIPYKESLSLKMGSSAVAGVVTCNNRNSLVKNTDEGGKQMKKAQTIIDEFLSIISRAKNRF